MPRDRRNGVGKPSRTADGGSGGGVRIDVGTLSGSGVIVANGGNGGSAGGGGGRVAVYYNDIEGFDQSRITASGGAPNGQAGTVVVANPPVK